MKLRHAVSTRPTPRFDAFLVKNRERLETLNPLPDKFKGLSAVQVNVLGILYGQWLKSKSTSLTQLGTTQETVEAMHKMRLLDLKGANRQRAYIRYFGIRAYEVIYWHEVEKLNIRRAKRRAQFAGKRGQM